MAAEKTTAAEDLAFLRQLVAPADDGAYQRGFGRMYALWGMAFAVPLFVEWLRIVGLVALPQNFWVIASVVVTVAIIGVTVVVARRSKPTLGVQARAVNAVFAGIGWANVAVLAGLILVAVNQKDGGVMMIHALVVFAFQGAAWYAVWALRKVAWHGLVAAGWFVSAAVMGATIPTHWFVLLASLSLFLLMALPGWIMLRTAPTAD